MTKEQRRQARDRQQREALDAYIKRVVDEAPPLTQEQRAKLAVLLEPVRIKPRTPSYCGKPRYPGQGPPSQLCSGLGV